MHDRRVQGGLISAAKIVNGQEHGGCRGRGGGSGRRSGQSTSVAATAAAAAAAAAVVLVLLVTVLMVVVMIVVLHSGGANHHAAHLATVSDVMYDDENTGSKIKNKNVSITVAYILRTSRIKTKRLWLASAKNHRF